MGLDHYSYTGEAETQISAQFMRQGVSTVQAVADNLVCSRRASSVQFTLESQRS